MAYTVVARLASGGSAQDGSGYTVYSQAFLVTQVPHAIVTVSLATAVLPLLSRAAADGGESTADAYEPAPAAKAAGAPIAQPDVVVRPRTAKDVAAAPALGPLAVTHPGTLGP